MSTRCLSIPSDVNEPFEDFAQRVSAHITSLGDVQIIDFDLSRKNSVRAGSGFSAQVLYNDNGGASYDVFFAYGTAEEVDDLINAQFVGQIYPRARFVQTLYTGNERRLSLGVMVIVATTPTESQIGRQSVLWGHTPDFVGVAVGDTKGIAIIDRDNNDQLAVDAQNRGGIPSEANERTVLVWRDPSSNMWYFYPACY